MKDFKQILLRRRVDLLKNLEKQQANTRFVVFMSSLIDYQDAVTLYNRIRSFNNVDTIKLIIDSPGGDPDAAYKIVRLLRQYCKRLVGVVPFTAKSAATLINLGTDEIEMGPVSELGPIDPQIRSQKFGLYPAQAIRDTVDFLLDKVEQTSDKYSEDTLGTVLFPIIDKMDPLLLGQLERSVKAAKQYAEALLSDGMLRGNQDVVKSVVQKLSEGYFSHGYVIDRQEAAQMGLNIKSIDGDYWNNVWELYYSYQIEKQFSDEEPLFFIDTLISISKELQDNSKKNPKPDDPCEISSELTPAENGLDEMLKTEHKDTSEEIETSDKVPSVVQ